MKKIFWKLLSLFDSNKGYETPLQKRFNIGDKCKISPYKTNDNNLSVGDDVTVIENGRYDYLVQGKNSKAVVYQFELI